jgi:hypothetical protein
MTNKPQQVAANRYYFYGEGHAKCECVPEEGSEEASYMGRNVLGKKRSRTHNEMEKRHMDVEKDYVAIEN